MIKMKNGNHSTNLLMIVKIFIYIINKSRTEFLLKRKKF